MISTTQFVMLLYFAVTGLSFYTFVEKDPKERDREDVAMSGALAIAWPIVLVLIFCVVAYLISTGNLPPKKKKGNKP